VNPSFRVGRNMFPAAAKELPEDAISSNTFGIALDAAAIVTPAERWDIAKRDIERGSEGDRSRERSTPAAVHFPSAEKLSVDTSRRFPFTLPFRNAEGEGVCFVFDGDIAMGDIG